jgi:hypothetical protein
MTLQPALRVAWERLVGRVQVVGRTGLQQHQPQRILQLERPSVRRVPLAERGKDSRAGVETASRADRQTMSMNVVCLSTHLYLHDILTRSLLKGWPRPYSRPVSSTPLPSHCTRETAAFRETLQLSVTRALPRL